MLGFEDYIRSLTNESLTGIITPGNKAILEKAILENPQAYAVWQDTVAHFESAPIQQILKEDMKLPSEIILEIYEAEERKRHNRRKLIITFAAAAVAIGIIVLSIHPEKKQKTGITLQIANEDPINLTDGKLQAGGVTLNNNAGSLSYQAKAPSTKLNKLSVPTGMTYQLVLADGSKIWLNAATTLEFPFTFNNNTREITINGEAYLEIAQDETKPFIVHIPGNNTIQVLGTTFNVNTYNQPRIALVTGAVKVKTAAGKSLQLQPGYEAVAADNELQSRQFDADNLLAWRQGQYYFSKATLQEVSEVISRWYGTQVIIDKSPISNKTFTGNLNRNRPLEEFLIGIHQLMDVEYYYQDDILHLK
ncbi:FecR family protein [Chitinophaga sp. CF118]|uniref:FecR family protein n=1 Tax=Chitinophaga sp. CF118 TaxID=1884367 RepID=UPI0008EE49C8|nr:FecR family protein [Chitinophaga sp. CF118]SFE98067.1 FecR family protein [Chitinophaga sp. CF118]